MKSPWFILVLWLLLAAHAFAEAPKVKVSVRFYELSGQAALAKHPSLRAGRMVDELRMPPFAMESGKSAEVSVERDFGASTPKNMPKVGVWLEIRPTVKGRRIAVSVDSKRVEYVGPRAGRGGVFEIRKRSDMRESAKYGEPVRFDLGIRKVGWRSTEKRVPQRLVAMLIFTRV